MSTARAKPPGMSTATAARVEMAIILLCAASLLFIFQPFSKLLSGIGLALSSAWLYGVYLQAQRG